MKEFPYLMSKLLLNISTNVHTSDKIAPVCLPLRGVEPEPLVGIDMVTAGWGKTGNGKPEQRMNVGTVFVWLIGILSGNAAATCAL